MTGNPHYCVVISLKSYYHLSVAKILSFGFYLGMNKRADTKGSIFFDICLITFHMSSEVAV